MNYYNPYMYSMPVGGMNMLPRTGLFSRLFNGINFSSILNGTQRTLNIVNQTIPLVRQAQPLFKNAKTMFKVMNEFKKVDTPSNVSTKTDSSNNLVEENNSYYSDGVGPTFFA